MKKKKNWVDGIFAVFTGIHAVIALVVGLAAAYLLGSVFGMGVQGYALGFVLGFGLAFGAISF